jgi:hypothetical protein
MPELGTSGSVRGVCSNAHPYRDKDARYPCSRLSAMLDFFDSLLREVTIPFGNLRNELLG